MVQGSSYLARISTKIAVKINQQSMNIDLIRALLSYIASMVNA